MTRRRQNNFPWVISLVFRQSAGILKKKRSERRSHGIRNNMQKECSKMICAVIRRYDRFISRWATEERWRYALVPVWVMTYKGKNGKIYYYTINGQNGKVCGELPVDYKKLSLVSTLITGVVFLLGLAGGLLL